jgi:hypothetical protein
MVFCLVVEPAGRRFGDPLERLLFHGEVGPAYKCVIAGVSWPSYRVMTVISIFD